MKVRLYLSEQSLLFIGNFSWVKYCDDDQHPCQRNAECFEFISEFRHFTQPDFAATSASLLITCYNFEGTDITTDLFQIYYI
jgi:hypothetical protein